SPLAGEGWGEGSGATSPRRRLVGAATFTRAHLIEVEWGTAAAVETSASTPLPGPPPQGGREAYVAPSRVTSKVAFVAAAFVATNLFSAKLSIRWQPKGSSPSALRRVAVHV